MEILYANVSLSEGGRESPSGLTIDVQRAVQTAPLTRAPNVSIFPRSNTVWSISFSVTYLKADLMEAQDFAAGLDTLLPAQGDLVLIPSDTNGVGQEITYQNAALTGMRAVTIGVTVVVNYAFIAENRKVLPA